MRPVAPIVQVVKLTLASGTMGATAPTLGPVVPPPGATPSPGLDLQKGASPHTHLSPTPAHCLGREVAFLLSCTLAQQMFVENLLCAGPRRAVGCAGTSGTGLGALGPASETGSRRALSPLAVLLVKLQV